MRRNFIAVFVAYAVALVSVTSDLNAQFAPAYPNGQYPQSSQQPYPAQGYPQGQGFPQAPGYPQGQYPQQAGNMDAEGAPDPQADRQHGVARISTLQGDVNLRRGDTGELVAAVTNAPVSGQDHLQTAPGSFAEVQLDAGNIVRLAPNTDLGFADLQYHRYQVQLGAGTVIYRVLRDVNSQAEIDTPSIAVRPTMQGELRISVLEDNTTQITVRAGQAEIYSPRGTQTLGPGQTMLVRGDPASPEFQSGYEIARDGFDSWSENRDQRLLASQSYRYVSQDVYGADDLDAYGNWVPSQYGQAWQPRPPYEGWSPYSNGQWEWTNYYGWTWVDSSPWGWAPYHYGRWFQSGGAWCWWPGARGGSYGWSPALVGFFGLGVAGAILSGIGWAALAPFEAFHSWWGRSAYGYGRGGFGAGFGYNSALYRNGAVAGMYRNAAFRGGAMSASLGRFSGPGQHFSAVGESQLRGASAFRGQIPISATRVSRQFSDRQAFTNPHLAFAGNRPFFQRQQASGFNRGNGFGQTQRSGQTQQGFGSFAGGNRSADVGQNSRNPAANARAPQQGQQYGNAGRSSAGGWQRFGDPGVGASNFTGSRPNAGSGSGSESGWHRFGDSAHSPSSFGPSYGSGNFGNNNRRPQQRFYSAPSAPNNSSGNQGYGNRGNNNPGAGNQYRSPGNNPAMGSRQSFSAPGGSFNYGGGGRSSFSAPRMNGGGGSSNFGGFSGSRSAPQQHFSAPSAPHYSAPSSRGGGGSFGGGGPSHSGGGGGGSSHSSGGGHSSSSGHHGR